MRIASHQHTDLRVMNHEQRLIEQAKEGDLSAFEALIFKYDRDILGLSLRLLGNREAAKDAYQETFLKVFRTIGQFQQQSSLYTWIFRIASNVCIDRLQKRRKPGEEVWIDNDRSKSRTPLTEVLPVRKLPGQPERALVASRLRERISRALNALSAKERLVFELKHYQGLKLKQIGEMIGSDENTIKDCLYRATRKLSAELTSDPNCPSLSNRHMTDDECAPSR
jgi:RNA polymerase sigma-70 factor, ECF subfamily